MMQQQLQQLLLLWQAMAALQWDTLHPMRQQQQQLLLAGMQRQLTGQATLSVHRCMLALLLLEVLLEALLLLLPAVAAI
jgi:hypothetical protein